MPSYWKKKDGSRWNSHERTRVARRFREHVRTTKNPRGRIHREPCVLGGEDHGTGEAHHVDYSKPWVVMWLCRPCHRRVERGEVKLDKRWIRRRLWDYSSLVIQRPRGQRHGPKPEVAEGVPF